MPENPKKKRPSTINSEKTSESAENSSWGCDQQKHSYYYDDDHGYEVYDPEKEENDDEDNASV